MAQHRPPNARPVNALPLGFGRLVAAVVLAMLFLGSIAVVAAAQPDAAARARPSLAADARPADATSIRDRSDLADRGFAAIAIDLGGVGVDHDNQTYDVAASGKGLVKAFFRDGHFFGIYGYARLTGNVTDANGTVIEDFGRFPVALMAHRAANDTWHWSIVSRAHAASDGAAKLALRGTSGGPDNGTLPFEGAGHAIFLPDGADARLGLSLDVAGVIQRLARDRPDAHRVPVTLNLTGTASGRDNQSLAVAIVGKGLVHAKTTDGNVSAMRGVIHVVATFSDGDQRNHTARLPVAIRGAADDNGTWHWRLASMAQEPSRDVPRLALGGTGTGPIDGVLDLEGEGFVLVRSDGGAQKLVLDVDGSLARA